VSDWNERLETVQAGFTRLNGEDQETFDRYAEIVLSYQKAHNPVYSRLDGFTYLPVQAFKLAPVATFDHGLAEKVFLSSGTRGQIRSRHYIKDISIYERSVLKGFDMAITQRFGWEAVEPVLLAHLPAYAEESSLVHMLKTLIAHRGGDGSGFFLDETETLDNGIQLARQSGRPLLLFGAAFGLLDLLEGQPWPLPDGSVVVETGGMKTHRREVKRSALHHILQNGFDVPADRVVSEYGMCELLSQCYTDAEGVFQPPPWMRFEVLDPSDGQTVLPKGEEGVLALFDLANMYSVSAILTGDRARAEGDGFTIHGRLSSSELRGCNFLIESA